MNRRDFVLRSTAAAAFAMTVERGITGGALLPLPSSEFAFARLRYASGNWDADPNMPTNLLHALAAHTRLRLDARERIIDATSNDLFAHPFLYLTGNRTVQFTPRERERLRHYLRSGGFLFVDDCEHDINGEFARSFEAELSLVLDHPEERLRALPNDHELYRAYFDFPAGPPTTSHEVNGWGDRLVHPYLRGAWVGNRLAVLYSNKDYGCEWNYDPRSGCFMAHDTTRFGVNIIVYALRNAARPR
ncbi:MAG: twin-arginine translocation pathway signal [Pyrinomonas sp.]|uniref:DUF4159 domain-containing protein n=1 Tax=Pyrinomonas sp. TaxID=2080306 RepID=UPI00331B9C8F